MKLHKLGRVATIVLASSMLIVAVLEAQGCRREPQMLPATKAGPFIQSGGGSGGDVAIDGELHRPDVGGGSEPVDAGTDAGSLLERTPPMIPATKSGVFIHEPLEEPAPPQKQQNQAPE